MENISIDLMTALPELIVLGMAMVILLADLFLKPQNKIILYGLAQAALFVAAYFTISSYQPGVGYAFSNMFVDDPLAHVLKLMILLGTAVIFVYTRQYMQLRKLFRGEYYALVLFAVLGFAEESRIRATTGHGTATRAGAGTATRWSWT